MSTTNSNSGSGPIGGRGTRWSVAVNTINPGTRSTDRCEWFRADVEIFRAQPMPGRKVIAPEDWARFSTANPDRYPTATLKTRADHAPCAKVTDAAHHRIILAGQRER
jgi:hypothetical protein